MSSHTVAIRQPPKPGSSPSPKYDSSTGPDITRNKLAVTSSTDIGMSSQPTRSPTSAVKMTRGGSPRSPSWPKVESADGKQESPAGLSSPSVDKASAKAGECALFGAPGALKAEQAPAKPACDETHIVEAILSGERDPTRNNAMFYTVRYLPSPAYPEGLQKLVLEDDLLSQDEEAVYKFWELTKDGRPPILEEDGRQKWEAYDILDWRITKRNRHKVLVHWAGFRPVFDNGGMTWEPEKNMREVPAVAEMIDEYRAKNKPRGMAAKGKIKLGAVKNAVAGSMAVVKKVHVRRSKQVAKPKELEKKSGSVKRTIEEAGFDYDHYGADGPDTTGLRRSKRLHR